MGATSSKPDSTSPPPSKVAGGKDHKEPLTLNRSLLNEIQSTQTESQTETSTPSLSLLSAPRQSQLDSSIKSQIKSELKKLQSQEDSIRKSIELALERETLDKNKKSSEKGGNAGRGSNELKAELDELKKKVERNLENKKKIDGRKEIQESREKVEKCYRENPTRTLDCWKEVQDFKSAVGAAEKDFITSLST